MKNFEFEINEKIKILINAKSFLEAYSKFKTLTSSKVNEDEGIIDEF